MEKISLKLLERYKSLQDGFVWTDIPSFAVITGVNVVGKNQLLDVLRGRGNRPKGRGNMPIITREIASSADPVIFFSENTTQNGLSLNGLIV